MTLLNHFQQALVNLAAAKLRSFLAVLGILVGTAAVVALISCGQLATEKALAQFKALGTDLLAISVYEKTPSKSNNGENQIPLRVWRQIPERIPQVLRIAPYGTGYQPISFEGKMLQGAIIGADESLANIIHVKLARGHFVSFVESFEHFCVIGDTLARQIKEVSFEDPIGKQIRIGQALYTIIGIANPWKENGFFNEDINQSVIIPIAGMALVSKENKINNAVLLLKPDSPIDDVIAQVRQILIAQAPKLSFFPRSAKQIIASMENQGHIFTLLLAVIGSISLLVGGIGVMNVMLVSVSERKKEIGIRKAVGAKNKEIQTLFLVESVMLSLLGGFLGVILGLIFTRVVAYFSGWSFTVYFMPPLAGFAVSVATGIFFGFYPARRAAKLEPMVSLRSE
ncbi:ABC transporter permease [Legionella micdadei]|uniref:ABC transport system permease protein n=1 Tax=Legionella micdadei TaxID=451 RepID=A0A098GDA3_LEGMI|nr:ABC transporter permease [Legionella micdadei]ARG96249.1 ABC transporter permease [Legionella micdadei]ARG99005.1 ABC transporter permease [Legionella micdadei]KTD29063.1 ABC transporter permease [Legionella micdadei]CEG59426.1 ABC transporter, permease [Legionella micdadei]SCX89551.1 putative ABC transport system permease protein [Legionella micdadei]